MGYSGFILTFLIASIFVPPGVASAETIEVVGAQKHSHPPEQTQVDVDDVIRAEEDPNFTQYIDERAKEEKEERAAALSYEKKHEAEQVAEYKIYLEYRKEKREKAVKEALLKAKNRSKDPAKQQIDETKAWNDEQEKYRQAYVKDHEKEIQKQNAERTARFQKALPTLERLERVERLPASDN